MNIQKLLQKSLEKLKKTSPTPQLDAEVLLAHTLGKNREYLLAHPEKELNTRQITNFNHFIKRRMKCEPIAYILGRKEFYGLNFKVNRNVLIPRPETELLVEETLKLNPINRAIIDIGTGSGNIIISIAKKLWTSNVHNGHSMSFFGIDISLKALAIAKHNAKKNKVEKKIKFLQSDLLNCFFSKSYKLKANKLIIVANLPYLSKKIYSSCSPDIKKFEPQSALFSANDGLAHYEKLFQQIVSLKKDCFMFHVSCFMEISPEQKQKIQKLIKKYFPCAKIKFQKDLAQKWRVVSFEI